MGLCPDQQQLVMLTADSIFKALSCDSEVERTKVTLGCEVYGLLCCVVSHGDGAALPAIGGGALCRTQLRSVEKLQAHSTSQNMIYSD